MIVQRNIGLQVLYGSSARNYPVGINLSCQRMTGEVFIDGQQTP
jgi:hypothetical protein